MGSVPYFRKWWHQSWDHAVAGGGGGAGAGGPQDVPTINSGRWGEPARVRHQPGLAWLEFTMYCIVYTLDKLLLHFWSSILPNTALKQNKQTRVKSSSMALYETEEKEINQI